MGQEKCAELLQESHLFKCLDDGARRRILADSTVESFQQGEVIVKEGSEGQELYLIIDGTVRIQSAGISSEVLDFGQLSRGACIGEIALVTGTPRTATVAALEDCTMLRIDAALVRELMDQHPTFKRLLQAVTAGRARRTLSRMEKNGS